MVIADRLKKSNRAEYLLYMWQVEDVVRAYRCDAERLTREYVSRFDLDEAQHEATAQWYADICAMMHSEGVTEKGHIQLCKNILQELAELHEQLLTSPHFPYYREMYYHVLPYIVELRSKRRKEADDAPDESELETCFNVLYGIMMLRLQGKEIVQATQKAVKDITTMLGQLSDYYFKDKEKPLEF